MMEPIPVAGGLVVTQVNVTLSNPRAPTLKAFASVWFNGSILIKNFQVRDVDGRLHVTPPTRMIEYRCPNDLCRTYNHIRAKFCNECGKTLDADQPSPDKRGRTFMEIFHPGSGLIMQVVYGAILAAYRDKVAGLTTPSAMAGTVPGGRLC